MAPDDRVPGPSSSTKGLDNSVLEDRKGKLIITIQKIIIILQIMLQSSNLRNNGTVWVIIIEFIWQNLFITGRVAKIRLTLRCYLVLTG